MFTDLKNAVVGTYLGLAEGMVDTLKESKFLEEGVLTPEEFVAAGDLLVFKCSTWSWGECADPSKAVDYLPLNKQFLITRKVQCKQRYFEAKKGGKEKLGEVVEEGLDGDDDGWLAVDKAEGAGEDDGDGETAEIVDVSKKMGAPVAEDDFDFGSDDEVGDLDAVGDENLVEEDPAAKPKSNIVQCRTYDISITYDKYYQTPKVWLFGWSETQQPLTPEEIFMDISSDHAKKTVTVDNHPGLNIPFAYIHPCKHAHVMKKFIERMLDSGKTPRADQYMLLFLKMLGGVIPTMAYDNTLDYTL